ncbi:MAG: hypothetical protein JWO27_917 [Frankiales bacterium]|nr:hypothetical protein [Frankiales bacterium]
MAQRPSATPPPSGTPGPAPSALLKVQGSSKLAFGATTAALVTLASGGTAVLVAHATHSVSSPTALPARPLPPDAAAAPGGLIVGQPAGTAPATPASPVSSPAPVDPTQQALQDALAHRSLPGRRTLTAPLVPLLPSTPALPQPPPVIGPVAPPVVGPTTPSTPPPVVAPPPTRPGSGQGHVGDEGTSTGTENPPPTEGPTTGPQHPGNGKGQGHVGKQGNQGNGSSHSSSHGSSGSQSDSRSHGQQAQRAKHARTPSLGKGRHAR